MVSIVIIIFLIAVIIFLIVRLRRKKLDEFDGDMIVQHHDDGSTLATLALGKDPAALLEKDYVTFRVVQEEDSHI